MTARAAQPNGKPTTTQPAQPGEQPTTTQPARPDDQLTAGHAGQPSGRPTTGNRSEQHDGSAGGPGEQVESEQVDGGQVDGGQVQSEQVDGGQVDGGRAADWVELRNGVPVVVCDADGPPVGGVQDALDLIGAAFGRSDVVALPAARLDARFFTLSTGLAGEIMQKFVNYRIRLAIVGDISEHLAASSALRALVHESNRGRQIWFVADLAELDSHLSQPS